MMEVALIAATDQDKIRSSPSSQQKSNGKRDHVIDGWNAGKLDFPFLIPY